MAWLVLTASACCTAAPPELNWLYPAGGQRGQAFEVTAGGALGEGPFSVWCDSPELTVVSLEEKGKFRVESSADALPGVYWLRLTSPTGASTLRPLVLGQLPEVSESEPNDGPQPPDAAPAEADAESGPAAAAASPRVWGQEVTLPSIINGRLGKRDDVDAYSVSLEAGQTLVASLQAQTVLGSPVDAILQVAEVVQRPVSSASPLPPRTEAYVLQQNHDAEGLDPQLEFHAERAGTYVLRAFGFPSAPNSTIAFTGGDELIYRLTLSTQGIVDHALPLTISATPESPAKPSPAGSEPAAGEAKTTAAAVRVFGPGLDAGGLAVTAYPVPGKPAHWRAFAPGISGAVELPAAERPSIVLPSVPASGGRVAEAVEMPLPVAASGRLAAPGEVGAVRFEATKGQPLRISLQSRVFGFPLDPVVVVRDADDKPLEKKDGGSNRGDVSFDFNPPADGLYGVEIQDLHGRGGLRFLYQLTVEPVRPAFALTVSENRFAIPPGGTVEIPVAVERLAKFAEPITVGCEGLPAGVEAEAVVSAPEGDTAKLVTLVLRASDQASAGTGSVFRITGAAESSPTASIPASFSLNLPFAGNHTAVWLSVTK